LLHSIQRDKKRGLRQVYSFILGAYIRGTPQYWVTPALNSTRQKERSPARILLHIGSLYSRDSAVLGNSCTQFNATKREVSGRYTPSYWELIFEGLSIQRDKKRGLRQVYSFILGAYIRGTPQYWVTPALNSTRQKERSPAGILLH